MGGYLFTNKFKVGDEVICLKSRYKEAWIQPGDIGIVIKVDVDSKYRGYKVHKKGMPKNEWCFKTENRIDFADIKKREPEQPKIIRVKRIPPIDPKIKRLKLIKVRAKIFKKQKAQLFIEQDLDNYND